MEFSIESPGWPDGLQAPAEKAIRTALVIARIEMTGPAELSILLTSDEAQQQLNAQWRQQDKATNVLSFPQLPAFAPVEGLIGDVSLAHETLVREAKELQIDFHDHFIHLLVHGFLHCLGYDHENEQQALVMEGLETQILSSLGIDDPYAEF